MSSLPSATCLPEVAIAAIASPASTGTFSLDDEQSLRDAFHAFALAADSLERSYTRLQAEVERLRRELDEAQAQLRREQALAEVSALLAHEIRNPLGSMELFAGLLAESALDGESRKWVEHLQAGLRTLAATVNNVLHFHCLPQPERALVDLGHLLDWAREFFAPMAHQARVELSVNHRLAGVLLAADRHRLEQVLANLVLNAVRAMPGGGWLELRGNLIQDARAASIVVTDTGPGISPEVGAQLFQPFVTTKQQGMGVGLSISRTIVEAHGGTIAPRPNPEGGTVFSFTLPAVTEEEASNAI